MSAGALLTTLLGAIIGLALLAKKLGVAYPVVFVIGGAVLGAIPGTPRIALAPDLVFLLFLPPLIFGDGWTTDVRTFLRYRQPILLLAIGLVLFTSFCVAHAAHELLGFPLALGYVLGAILSPTDAVATDAIAEELNLPRRLAAIINGESLVNDASGLVVYAFAVAPVLTGTFSLGLAVLQFVYVVAVGLAIGIGGGAILVACNHAGFGAAACPTNSSRFRSRSSRRSRSTIPADALHASGVLAALSGGMMLSQKSSKIFNADSRIAASAVWNLLFFTFNGAAFVLIGLQLRSLVGALTVYRPWTLARWSLGIAAVVVSPASVGVRRVASALYDLSANRRVCEGPAPPWQVHVHLRHGGHARRRFARCGAGVAGAVSAPRLDLIRRVRGHRRNAGRTGAAHAGADPALEHRRNRRRDWGAASRWRACSMAEAVRARMRELEPTIHAAGGVGSYRPAGRRVRSAHRASHRPCRRQRRHRTRRQPSTRSRAVCGAKPTTRSGGPARTAPRRNDRRRGLSAHRVANRSSRIAAGMRDCCENHRYRAVRSRRHAARRHGGLSRGGSDGSRRR